jgi:hypothetical protein
MCEDCKHLDRSNRPTGTPLGCKAFPEGIPDEIYVYGEDPTKPYPGDNGVRLEPVE